MKNSSFNALAFILLLFSFFFFTKEVKASHVAGGYIQIECTGVPGVYNVSLVLYRDCSGVNLGNNANINFTNTCGLNNINVNLTRVSQTEVSQVCIQQAGNTTCNNGPLPGYEEHVFEGTVNLGDCDTWTANYNLCCRNTVINLVNDDPFNVSTQINTATDNCNDTPSITAQPEPYVCINQPVSYNLGAFEPNGDSIVYSLVDAVQGINNPVPYTPGYTGAIPITGAAIDPVSGTITFTPTIVGAFVIVIRMIEYNSNGDIVTITDYEYQTYVENCNNQTPQPPAAGVTNVTGSIVQNGPNDLTLCQGNNGCFDIIFNDPDGTNALTVQSNIAQVLPGATVTTSGSNPLTLTICWTPTVTQGTETLNFLVQDDACPIVGQNNYAVTINVVDPGITSVITTTELCLGTDLGTATISMTGGNPPFVYTISGTQTGTNSTGLFDNLPPGNYNYTVNSGGGCDVNGTFVIDPGAPLPVTTSSINLTCNSSGDGSATITPSGGIAPFTYDWSQGGTPLTQNTQTISGLTAGTYDVTLTDNIGCTTDEIITITEPTVLTGTLLPTPANCNGSSDGEINVNTVSGGTSPYGFSLNGGTSQSGTSFNGLTAGSYEVEISDDHGCSLTLTSVVTEPTALLINIDISEDATCGANSGSINLSATGGISPYTYSIGGANQSTGVFTNLAPNTYTVTVTDGNGCSNSTTVTIADVIVPTAIIDNQINLSCFGGNNGQVIIGTTNAVAPITYSLNGGTPQASNSFAGLTAGTYTVEMIDGNGCFATTNVTITQPAVMNYTTTPTNASCQGDCNGQIVVAASGGTAPYTFSSNNGVSFGPSATLNNLCAGNIQIVVSDLNGCLANSVVNIAEPTGLTATLTGTDPDCNLGTDGEIQVAASGGTSPYLYSVNNGTPQSSNLLTGLSAGVYSVLVEDANGCQYTISQTLFNPPGITLNQLSNTSSNCGNNDGELEVGAVGTNGPFQYSINGSVNQASGIFPNITGGSYQVIVTNTIGCQDSSFFGINDIQMTGTLVSTTDISCFQGSDGAVEVINVGGALPIVFELDNNGATQSTGVFTGLSAGGHIATIVDNGLCVFTIPFTLIQPDKINFDGTIQNVDCNGASTGQIALINVVGGTGLYEYSIDNGNTYQPTSTFTGLAAGTHTITVRDDEGCTVDKDFIVQESSLITFTETVFDLNCNNDNTGVIQLAASNGNPGYTYSNDNGISFQNSSSFLGLSAGAYTMFVQDNLGCQVSRSIVVNEPAPITATYALQDATCFGVCDGEIQITANGGTPGYTYSIDNGINTTVNNTITGICASSFDIIIKDANGCVNTTNQAINEPSQVAFTSVETPSTCEDPNGEISITATGGTPAYTYSINNGASFVAGNSFTGLLAGTFNLVVEDNNGCPATGTQIVTNEASPTISMALGTDPSCNGGANGQVIVTAIGGTGGLFYSINSGAPQASATLTGLTAGSYSVTVEDANGCTDTETVVLGEPTPLTFTSVPTTLACFQNSSGSIAVTASGGTPVYQYSFNGGSTFNASSSNNFIAAGTYNIVVKDANNCQITGTETVTEPTQLVLDNATVTDANCKSACDGEIQLSVSGGMAPYTYDWLQGVAGVNDDLATQLCAGTYDFVIEDDNGCQVIDNAFVDEPDSVILTDIFETNITCNGDCDGEIEVISATATEFSIDGGTTFQTGNVFSNICANVYNLVAKDADGCLVERTVDIWEANQISLELTDDTTVCNNFNFKLVGTGLGGIQPYTYQWSNGGSLTDTLDIVAAQTDSYSLAIFDFNGCTVPAENVTVTVIPLLDMNIVTDTTICREGVATISAQGIDGLPAYAYTWSSGQTTSSIDVTPSVNTTYTATVTDQCGDQVSMDVIVELYPTPSANLVADKLSGCVPLDVNFLNITNPSDVGSNCVWTINEQTFNGCTGINYTFTEGGCYDVNLQIESPFGCMGDTTFFDYICVDEYPTASFNYSPDAPTTINNIVDFTNTSEGATNYEWTFEKEGTSSLISPTITFSNIEIGQEVTVCLIATSRFGCEDEVCDDILFKDEFIVYVPNSFTPDGDKYNPMFSPRFPPDSDIIEYRMQIYNRWGEIMFESFDSQVGWRGTYGTGSSNIVKEGTYIWKIQIVEGRDLKQREFIGHVTLLK
ncbi:hypothetical protein ERX46_14160 [Brumimicrobium glaciale]|uniref:T9SS type B sorting domain-containing protein n=1 Tax=Brumimicrobium glaciale TaxID=200475 RepID=A0A4Q4KID8_9FLAO|nr:gliding motility-associated C-terminal domain-containing protein [Brumimicrobium glaciale]RYM32417.1 hypothetical protein ERX46_14160 [Brumimicrobium glaciale]